MNITQRIEEQFYNKKAIMELGNRRIYFEEFSQQLNASVAYFSSQEKLRWALCLEDPFEFTVVFLALLIAQKIPILLPNYQIGTREDFAGEYDGIITELKNGEIENTSISRDIALEQEIILFTSGSTGKPKKVRKTFKTLLTEVEMLENVFGHVMKDSSVYSTVSHQHIYGLLFAVLWPLLGGRTSLRLSLSDMEQLVELLASEKPMILVTSPSLLSRLILPVKTKSIACVFSSGGLLKQKDAERLDETLNLKPFEILGSTETGGVAFRQQRINAHWKALPGVSLAQDERSGCLWVKSPYFDHEEAFLMGDKVVMHEESYFELLERDDRIVKVEGKRLSLLELEEKIKNHDYIEDAYGVLTEDKRQYVTLALILNEKGKMVLAQEGKQFVNAKIHQWLSRFYEPVLVPKKIRYVTHFPMNTQGKLILADLLTLCETAL